MRAKIELPGKFHFTTEIPVRIGDINYAGHLGNEAILALAQEARVRLLRLHKWGELDIEGRGTIMADAMMTFESESFYGDIIVVDLAVTNLESRSCDFVYKLSNRLTGREIARLKTRIIFYDYASRKPVSMPEAFRSKFAD